MIDRLGQQIGNYRLIRHLGKGGFADTYLGEHIYLKTYAAIKILQAQLAQFEQESFINEARTIANLKHPNIIRVLEFGVEVNAPYLVMDYAPNGTLRLRHPRGVPVPPAVVAPYVKQMAAALQFAHEQKVVHRDVKPENMLIGANNEILLSDFGIAIIAQNTRTQNPQNVAGTVTYMAPEQIQGKPKPASDQYALGVVVYEWLTGRVPFTGTYIEVAIQHERVAPPLLREYVASLPPEVERVALTALAKDPQQRFANIQAFAYAFEQAASRAAITPAYADPQKDLPTIASGPGPYMTPPGVQNQQVHQTGYGQPGPYAPQMTPSGQPNPYAGQPTPSGQPNPYTPQQTPSRPPISYTQPTVLAQPFPQTNPPIQPNMGMPQPVGQPQAFQQTATPGPAQPLPPKPASRRPSTLVTILIVVLALLVIGGSSLIYYAAIYQPNQIHAQATSTAVSGTQTSVAQVTGTAHANATSTAVVVNATNTAVAAATAAVVATQTALQNIYNQATGGAPTINDPLNTPDNFGWNQFNNSNGGCSFNGNAYHSSASSGYFTPCYASATNFSNLVLQVEITITSGHSGGLTFRDSSNDSGYYFRISTDGTYILERIDINSSNQAFHHTLVSGKSQLIQSGTNTKNVIAVVAQGNHLYLYVNQKYLDQASDNTYSSGQIGVYTDSDAGNVEAVFSNLQVWKL